MKPATLFTVELRGPLQKQVVKFPLNYVYPEGQLLHAQVKVSKKYESSQVWSGEVAVAAVFTKDINSESRNKKINGKNPACKLKIVICEFEISLLILNFFWICDSHYETNPYQIVYYIT